MSLRRTVVLGVVAAIGAVLFLFPLVTGMMTKVQGVEHLTGDLRASFEPQALAQTRADMDTVQTMSDQLQSQTLPALPNALAMSPDQFQDYMGQNFPDVASGIDQLDTILPKFEALVTGLETQAPNFRNADQIPTNFLPSTVVPFLFLIPGAVLFLLAVGALLRGRRGGRPGLSRAALVAGVVVGLVFVIAPLVLSVPTKAKAVDDLTAAFGPVFTDQGVAAVRSDMTVIATMSDSLQTQTVPALAGALKMDPGQFQDFMGQNFPDVATGMAQLNTILPRFEALVAGMEANVGNFQLAANIPTASQAATTLTWWFIVPGVALILLGGIGIAGGQPRTAGVSAREQTLETV
ncbi:hypothetical protein [Rhodococcus opacus]|uniref:hypothetical protein n=1 Tax=Rhodococcus opacus TaxID=37919 RepID=UPI002952A556|nr:hypothetical protein [Rhodococcus opacus]MDV7087676.1 hypothetical protein [Rhodococcus opacus]